MMPRTSMPCRRNEAAAVEITALAAGAGPPANRMATRRIAPGPGCEFEGRVEDDMEELRPISAVRQPFIHGVHARNSVCSFAKGTTGKCPVVHANRVPHPTRRH